MDGFSSRRCCALNCTSSDTMSYITTIEDDNTPVRMHKFPVDEKVGVRWIAILGLQNLDFTQIRKRQLKVCSKHFKDESYSCPALRHDSYTRLIWNAVPDPSLVLPRLVLESPLLTVRDEDEANQLYPPKLMKWNVAIEDSTITSENSTATVDSSAVQFSHNSIIKRAATTHQASYASKLKRARQQISRQQVIIDELQMQLAETKGQCDDNVVDRVVHNKLKQQSVRNRGMRWSRTDISSAIQLRHKSPAAYRLVRNSWKFGLPSESVLKRQIRQFFSVTGICRLTMHSLHAKLSTAPENERIATLCFDGMRLSASIRYDQHKDEIFGFEQLTDQDLDVDKCPSVVNEAVVAVLRGVRRDWKQAIAYYPVHVTLGQKGFKTAIDECLTASHQTGIRVIALVADQEAAQWACLSKQITLDKSFLCHPSTQEAVCVVVDVPHCLKNLRNALQDNNIEFEDGKIAK